MIRIRQVVDKPFLLTGASTLCSRLIKKWGNQEQLADPGWVFPKPSAICQADVGSIGIPNARANAIREFANGVERQFIAFDGTMDLDLFLRRTESLPGIGKWTANYIAMRTLNEPDAFPSGDLGLEKALQRAEIVGPSSKTSAKKMLQKAENWRPWRSYATMVLWQSLAH